jgi:hypothetical protein
MGCGIGRLFGGGDLIFVSPMFGSAYGLVCSVLRREEGVGLSFAAYYTLSPNQPTV